MKSILRIIPVLMLTLCFNLMAAEERPAPDIFGTYHSTNSKGTMLSVDANQRITSNMQLQSTNGMLIPIQFPHRLRWEEVTQLFSTQGYVTQTMAGPGIVKNCTFPVKLEADAYSDRLDVTLTFPQRVGVDQFGNCHSLGTSSFPVEFFKVRPE